jgi:hypothetical protein
LLLFSYLFLLPSLSLLFLCYNPLFSPQYFILPLFIHSLPMTLHPLLTFPTCHPTFLLSPTLTTTDYPTKLTLNTPSLCNPWHRTIHYNNWIAPQNTQWP